MKKFKLKSAFCGLKKGQIIEIAEKCVYNIYYKGVNVKLTGLEKELLEEIVEKDYEILSFSQNISNEIVKVSKTDLALTAEEFFKNKCWNIHSIKRLSDDEVFTVGDKLWCGVITKFEISGKNNILITCKPDRNDIVTTYMFGSPQGLKKDGPLLITEDGVDIYHLGSVQVVNKKTASIYARNCKVTKEMLENNKDRFLYFKDKGKAERYSFHNKKVFSLQDIHKLIQQEYPTNKNVQVLLYQKLLHIANNK